MALPLLLDNKSSTRRSLLSHGALVPLLNDTCRHATFPIVFDQTRLRIMALVGVSIGDWLWDLHKVFGSQGSSFDTSEGHLTDGVGLAKAFWYL